MVSVVKSVHLALVRTQNHGQTDGPGRGGDEPGGRGGEGDEPGGRGGEEAATNQGGRGGEGDDCRTGVSAYGGGLITHAYRLLRRRRAVNQHCLCLHISLPTRPARYIGKCEVADPGS